MARHEQKAQTRQRILESAGRSFRKAGYGGVGVDGLSKEAGVTSGAFYVHFDSKSSAFREAVRQGVSDVANAVRQLQDEHAEHWWDVFVRFYLGEKRMCDLAESCGLQSLASEVARADRSARAAFKEEILQVATVIAAGPKSSNGPATVDEAYCALATLIGAVTLARAVDDPSIAKHIVDSAERALLPSTKERRVSGANKAKRLAQRRSKPG
jgi:TetR/AcrR family transcriptional regulator, transcriptional repressor for nem operon